MLSIQIMELKVLDINIHVYTSMNYRCIYGIVMCIHGIVRCIPCNHKLIMKI